MNYQSTELTPGNISLAESIVREFNESVFAFGQLKEAIAGINNKNIKKYLIGLKSIESGVNELKLDLWRKVVSMTNCREFLHPDNYRKLMDQVESGDVPDLTMENIKSTVLDLFNKKTDAIDTMVLEVFQALSPNHVTNKAVGFSKKMIFNYESYYSAEAITKLRFVIARIIGYRDVSINDREGLAGLPVGQWESIDGGVIDIIRYKSGTAHIKVHPDIAWQLNLILAKVLPNSIPSSLCKRKKGVKEFDLAQSFIPKDFPGRGDFTVYSCRNRDFPIDIPKGKFLLSLINAGDVSKDLISVMKYLGGKEFANKNHKVDRSWYWIFDYNPHYAILKIKRSGVMPCKKTHQAYFTPEFMAKDAVSFADIQDHHKVLEPQAGCMGIAKFLPVDQTLCLDIAPLHCLVQELHGYKSEQADFLKWARGCSERFDRIVCNPPFSKGRALLHCEAALGLLEENGSVTAIIPNTTTDKLVSRGYVVDIKKTYTNAFDDCGANVVLAVIRNNPSPRL